MKIIHLVFLFIPLALSCSQKDANVPKKETLPAVTEAQVNETGTGFKLYQKHCLACHQSDGRGNPGMYPPIVGNPFLEKDKNELIQLILEGKQGKIIVNGITYNGMMAPFSHLPDEEIAEICNYLYKSFSIQQRTVNAEDVKKVREKMLN